MFTQVDIINIKEGLGSFNSGFKMSIIDVASLHKEMFSCCEWGNVAQKEMQNQTALWQWVKMDSNRLLINPL